MISCVSYKQNNNVSFNGIVKIRQVLVNEVPTTDEKVIDKAIKIAKKILMRRCEGKNDSFCASIRRTYNYYDKDYVIPVAPIKGDTRHFFSHVQAGNNHFFVSGNDATRLDSAGIKIGHNKKAAKLAKGTELQSEKDMLHEMSKVEYGGTVEDVRQNFWKRAEHPQMAIFMRPNSKGKLGVCMIAMGNDTYKLDIPERIAYIKSLTEPKKLVQTNFLDKLA